MTLRPTAPNDPYNPYNDSDKSFTKGLYWRCIKAIHCLYALEILFNTTAFIISSKHFSLLCSSVLQFLCIKIGRNISFTFSCFQDDRKDRNERA